MSTYIRIIQCKNMNSLKMDKIIIKINYLFGSFAVLFSVLILTFYFHTAFKFNHLPTYGNPDPKYTDLYQYYNTLINYSFNLCFLPFLPWLFITIYKLDYKKHRKSFLFFLFSYTIALLIIFSNVFDWYAD